MHYIVFDLEFNQDLSSISEGMNASGCPFEIIQIGAIKLDSELNTIGTFNRYVKPTIYQAISTFITELTGITTDQLLSEELFPTVYSAYMDFIGREDSVFVTWGMSDMKELYRSAEYYQLDKKLLPTMYINLQPYTSPYLKFPPSKLLKLQYAVEALEINMPYPYHNALHDAYYTAEIFKKINNFAIIPKHYDPNFVKAIPRQRKKVIDIEMLIQQFEKMYSHEFSSEEKNMIILAYKMGKTGQFLKEI